VGRNINWEVDRPSAIFLRFFLLCPKWLMSTTTIEVNDDIYYIYIDIYILMTASIYAVQECSGCCNTPREPNLFNNISICFRYLEKYVVIWFYFLFDIIFMETDYFNEDIWYCYLCYRNIYYYTTRWSRSSFFETYFFITFFVCYLSWFD